MEQKRTLWILIAAGVFLCIVFGVAYGMSRAAGAKNEETTAISLKDSDDIWIAPYSDNKPSVKIPDANKKLDGADLVADLTAGKTPSIMDGLDYPEQGVTTATVEPAGENKVIKSDTKTETTTASSTDGTITTTFDLSAGSTSSGTVVAQNKAAEKAMKNADTKRGELAKTLDESTTKKTRPARQRRIVHQRPPQQPRPLPRQRLLPPLQKLTQKPTLRAPESPTDTGSRPPHIQARKRLTRQGPCLTKTWSSARCSLSRWTENFTTGSALVLTPQRPRPHTGKSRLTRLNSLQMPELI